VYIIFAFLSVLEGMHNGTCINLI